MNKVFLDLNKPAIDSVIEYLFNQEKYLDKESGSWNLSNVLLVVPSARVRRELLYQLLLYAQEKNVLLEIPKIVTIGKAPEFLYRQTRPFADDITQNLAWYRAIKMSDEEKRKEFLPAMPGEDDLEGQFLIGQTFSRLHQTLSAEMLNFNDEEPKSDRRIVNELVKFQKNHNDLNLTKEIERWKYFTEIKKNYLKILDENNLWDVQAARRYALVSPQPGDFETSLDIVLAGIVDLNRVQKAILEKVSDHVTALIYAQESDSDGFDRYGALNVKHWTDFLSCPLEDDQIIQVEKPEEQVLCAFEYIRQLSAQFTPDDFTIGAPDEKLVPFIQAAADKLGLQIDNSVGVPVTSTAPYALLDSILTFLESGSYESFANLVRHPAVYDDLSSVTTGSRRDLLSAIDNYQQQFFPFDVPSEDDIKRNLQNTDSYLDIHEDIVIVGKALEEIRSCLSGLMSKNEIAPKELRGIIESIFKKFPGEDNSFDAVVKTIIKTSERLGAISKDFTGKLSPQSALKMILLRMQSLNLPNGAGDSDSTDDDLEEETLNSSKPMIHVAGWLELVWDRAPVLTILSFNEGIVPQSANADLFLPNELRKELGILDNNRRLARDAYALKAIAVSKKGANKHLLIICGKCDTEDNPKLPSRLLFNENNFAARAKEFFDEDLNKKNPLPKFTLKNSLGGIQPGKSSKDVLDWAEKNLSGNVMKGVVKSISATQFKDYIQCPFRFFLKQVAGVQPTDYSTSEMEALSFGSVVHQVLQQWAQNELNNGRTDWRFDKDKLAKKFSDLVDELIKQSYPDSVLPAILVQKEIIKQRLKVFADYQATRNERIIAVEYKFTAPVTLNDNEEMTLIGKIDRIDQSADGTIVLLDYKTSKNKPEADHRDKDGNWINLQLPVYRHLFLEKKEEFLNDMRTRGVSVSEITDVKVGYFNLPEEVGEYTDSEWKDSDFDSAEDMMMEVMENIHNGVFWVWPPRESPKFDDYREYMEWLLRYAELEKKPQE